MKKETNLLNGKLSFKHPFAFRKFIMLSIAYEVL